MSLETKTPGATFVAIVCPDKRDVIGTKNDCRSVYLNSVQNLTNFSLTVNGDFTIFVNNTSKDINGNVVAVLFY